MWPVNQNHLICIKIRAHLIITSHEVIQAYFDADQITLMEHHIKFNLMSIETHPIPLNLRFCLIS